MPSLLDSANLVLLVTIVVTYLYIAYSALAIRRTLSPGVYRGQALGIGLLALAFVAIDLTSALPYSGTIGLLGGLVFYSAALLLLYWVDTSILAARRSDPLSRDTLGWSRVRKVVWIASVSVIFLTYGTFGYFALVGVDKQPDYLNTAFSVLFPIPIFIAAFSGVLVMPVAARRSKDATMRRHLEWFFVYIAIQLSLQGIVTNVLFPSSASTPPQALLIDGIALLLGLFPIYKSVKSLVPLYRFSKDV